MRNVIDESCKETEDANFVFITFWKNLAVYKVMWENIVEPGRLQMAIWNMRIARWITTATNSHSEYVIFSTTTMIRSSMLRCTYMGCSVKPNDGSHTTETWGLNVILRHDWCLGVTPAGLRRGKYTPNRPETRIDCDGSENCAVSVYYPFLQLLSLLN